MLYSKILMFIPVKLSEMNEELKCQGIPTTLKYLRDYLDRQGIVFEDWTIEQLNNSLNKWTSEQLNNSLNKCVVKNNTGKIQHLIHTTIDLYYTVCYIRTQHDRDGVSTRCVWWSNDSCACCSSCSIFFRCDINSWAMTLNTTSTFMLDLALVST